MISTQENPCQVINAEAAPPVERASGAARIFLPHQVAAIDAAARHYRSNDRGQLIMPCGTGKTATAAGIREKLGTKNTLVLLPSLVLVGQFKAEWAEWASCRAMPYDAMCVCSDADAGDDEDAVGIRNAELVNEATTDPFAIARFLGRPGPKVVFSTYQSLEAVRLATRTAGGTVFDMSVCDEAHRTAGTVMKLFGRKHADVCVPVRKRLYMTATPRVATGASAPGAGRIYDMDNPAVFGRPFFRMTFREAIDRNLLADYLIVTIGIADEQVREWMRESALCGDYGPIEEVARNFALDLAMRKYGARRAISYHSRVSAANDFSKRHSKLFSGVVSTHVSGRQSPSARKASLAQFASAPVATVSNAHCLVEGFDLKAVDMVYFCDPKRSTIDIVQAVGRALRIDASHPDKKGLIVLPVFHGSLADQDEGLADSDFRHVADVMRAMSEEDEVLNGEIALRASSRHPRSEPEKAPGLAEPPTIEGNKVMVTGFGGKLEAALFDQVVGKPSIDQWDKAYRAMLRYREIHPGKWPAKDEQCPEGIDLWQWRRAQLRAWHRGTMPEDRSRLLDKCGLFASTRPCWLIQYQRLRSYAALHQGIWPDKNTEYPAGNLLGAWCAAQRRARRKGVLSAERIQLLDGLKFPWGSASSNPAEAFTDSCDQSRMGVTV